MDILGNTVSEKTAIEIGRIQEHIHHKVDFVSLPLDNPIGWGRADWTTSPNWTVRAVTELPQAYFEANLLHELYHLCQVTEGFPLTTTKIQPDISASEQKLIDSAGGALTSVILDLDVCDRIASFGLDSDYFFDHRYQQAMETSFNFDSNLRNAKVSFTVHIAGIILQNSKWQSNLVLGRCQTQNKQLAQRAKNLAKNLKRIDHSTPDGCFKCLVAGYDYLGIWDWQNIDYRGLQFTSSEQANTFLLSSHLDSE